MITRRATLMGAALLAGCGRQMAATTPSSPDTGDAWTRIAQTGEGRIAVPGGSVVWRKFGDGPKTPLLAAHGGPGFPSDYIEPLKGLGNERAVYFWDQLGCGRSDKPSGAQYWVRSRFIEELARVRAGLNLTRLHYFGSSWGTMLGVDYFLERTQEGVMSATLDGPVMSVRRYVSDVRPMVDQLTPEHRAAVHEAERTGNYDTPAYHAADEEFTAQHIARHPSAETQPLWEKTFAGAGMESYLAMDGPSEFSLVGNLKDYEREDDLHRLTMPVLYVSGEYDTCTIGASREYASKTPHGEAVMIPNSGHCVHIDNPEAANAAIRAFLHRVET
ncbi:MAG TPA: proline iminopeptidase-family hydrolase [Caulobacterales bacterium]|nr:proline iminopeptidase-family hydrolase [Caulobacterales bacterium]